MAENSVVLTKAEKPHSYEFGKAGNRHKIYYDSVDDLKAHVKMLREAGFVDD